MVEEGSPQELLARGGRYAELWARQASLDDVAAPDSPAAAADGAASDGDDKEQVLLWFPLLELLHCVSSSGAGTSTPACFRAACRWSDCVAGRGYMVSSHRSTCTLVMLRSKSCWCLCYRAAACLAGV